MRASNYSRPTRRNPDDTVEIVAVLALVGVGGWAIWQQMRGFQAIGQGVGGAIGATGQGVGSALGDTGQAAGQTASAVGSGAQGFMQGIGNLFSGLGSDIHARVAAPSESALATQWRRAAAANASGSDPNDWPAFRAFTQQIGAPDPGPTPFSGWPHAFGGTVLNIASQQYE